MTLEQMRCLLTAERIAAKQFERDLWRRLQKRENATVLRGVRKAEAMKRKGDVR